VCVHFSVKERTHGLQIVLVTKSVINAVVRELVDELLERFLRVLGVAAFRHKRMEEFDVDASCGVIWRDVEAGQMVDDLLLDTDQLLVGFVVVNDSVFDLMSQTLRALGDVGREVAVVVEFDQCLQTVPALDDGDAVVDYGLLEVVDVHSVLHELLTGGIITLNVCRVPVQLNAALGAEELVIRLIVVVVGVVVVVIRIRIIFWIIVVSWVAAVVVVAGIASIVRIGWIVVASASSSATPAGWTRRVFGRGVVEGVSTVVVVWGVEEWLASSAFH
jgi:hypothetical protein